MDGTVYGAIYRSTPVLGPSGTRGSRKLALFGEWVAEDRTPVHPQLAPHALHGGSPGLATIVAGADLTLLLNVRADWGPGDECPARSLTGTTCRGAEREADEAVAVPVVGDAACVRLGVGAKGDERGDEAGEACVRQERIRCSCMGVR
jgi:hypothetical protein